MKTPRLLLSVAVFVTAALAVSAALESAQPLPHNPMPQYPSSLKMAGITRGRAMVALSVDAGGRVKDMLVLAYTHEHFARASVEALREWKFAPARFDGVPVPVQFDLTLSFTLEGAVITSGIMDHFFFDHFDGLGPNALAYRPEPAAQVDHLPARREGVAPKYALAAARDGVRGVVTVRFYIDEQGNVRLPATTSGADPYLTEQAMMAVRTWKFDPATRRGHPVLVAASQEFNFGGER